MQQQVLGRVTTQRELRKDYEIATELIPGASSGFEHFLGIGADRTNMCIDLRETEFHRSTTP